LAKLTYRFHLPHPLGVEALRVIREIPGVFAKERVVVSPLSAAWIVERTLTELQREFSIQSPKPHHRFTDADLEAIPELREWTFKFLAGYQKAGVLFAANGPDESAILAHPTGAGKSLQGIVWLLLKPGTGIFLTKAGARRTIQLEVERYTTVKPRVLWPPSDRRFDDDQFENLHEQRIVVAGWENLPQIMDHLLNANATSLVLDELHLGKGHKRWAAIPGRDEQGNDTKTFARLQNRVACAARISANANRRLGLTATLIPDRVRDLWGELDLVHPGDWGKYWGKIDADDVRTNSFVKRYCDLSLNDFGGWDDKGESNVGELKRRMFFVVHRVDSSVTHRDLPPMRRQIVYLTKADQNAPSSFTEELKKAQSRGAKSLQEVRLAEAASRKRGYVVDEVIEALKSKQKIVIFTGRHRDCERLEAAIKLAVSKVTWHDGTPAIFMAHGGHGTGLRDEIRERWMGNAAAGVPPMPGPAVLIGTSEAWGESYSLNHTDLALIVMLPLNSKQLWQWEGRFYRLGQLVPVLLKYIIAEGTYDEAVASILLSKLPAVADIQADSKFKEATAQFLGHDRTDDIEKRLLDAVMVDHESLFAEFTDAPAPELQ
jgi:hypothetical protein